MTLARRTPMSRGTSQLARTPMSRGTKGLETRAPLARKKPMDTRAPIAQGARTDKPRTRARDTGPSASTRALVDLRDGGQCVRCGRPASNRDHRQTRAMGGTKGEVSDRINTAAALLTLCGMGNTSGCHRWKDDEADEATRTGYRLPVNGIQYDPATVPVLTRAGWRQPTVDGRLIAVPAPPGGDALAVGVPV